MNPPALLFQYDEDWNPMIFIIGQTDLEAAKLQEIAAGMIEALKEKRPYNRLFKKDVLGMNPLLLVAMILEEVEK